MSEEKIVAKSSVVKTTGNDAAAAAGICPDCGGKMERRDVIRCWDLTGTVSELERVWHCKPCDVLWTRELVDPETLR